MEIKFTQEDIVHVARHLWGAPGLGGKFNSKISNAEDFLNILSLWLVKRINFDILKWIHNNKNDIDIVEIPFRADRELKSFLGLSHNEPFGYHGVIEITNELRSLVIQKPRGPQGFDKMEVNIIEGLELQPLDEFVVQLKKRPQEEEIFISTVYPGFLSPFLPDKLNQTEVEYLKSKEFWDKHAFISNQSKVESI